MITDPSIFHAPNFEDLAILFPAYRIECIIAVGGMGAVYKAQQISLSRPVAIKILPPEIGEDPEYSSCFEAEAKAMAKLNHPNLVGIYDFGRIENMLFIVMEFVPCGTLFQATHGKRVSARDAARMISEICKGLGQAHKASLIHRDIKPSNILLDADGSPKIADFGLSQSIGQKTKIGGIAYGTQDYSAPEVFGSVEMIDQRVDIFSLGVMLHELLTGKLPVVDPRPPSLICGCDRRFDAIVARATNPSADMRYATANEMSNELDALRNELIAKSSAKNPMMIPQGAVRISNAQNFSRKSQNLKPKTQRKSIAIIICLVGAILIASAGLFGKLNQDKNPHTESSISKHQTSNTKKSDIEEITESTNTEKNANQDPSDSINSNTKNLVPDGPSNSDVAKTESEMAESKSDQNDETNGIEIQTATLNADDNQAFDQENNREFSKIESDQNDNNPLGIFSDTTQVKIITLRNSVLTACSDSQTYLDDIRKKYKMELDRLMIDAKEKGDLSSVLAIKELGDNFSPLSKHAKLAAIQKNYTVIYAEGNNQVRLKILEAARKYNNGLDELVKILTKEEKIDDALKVRALKDQLAKDFKQWRDSELPPSVLAGMLVPTSSNSGISHNSKNFESFRAGAQRQLEIASGVMMIFCWCPPGDFVMGSPASEMDRRSNESQVSVKLTKGFWMAKTEVTQKQWKSVMDFNPSRNIGENLPVDSVNWNDIQIFLERLHSRLGNQNGWKTVLPTEAQWEYACRAGENGLFSGGIIDEVAWYDRNSGWKTHDVGTKKANSWGLHDMHGNVWEWCHDVYHNNLPGGVNPQGNGMGSNRVGRGGGWHNHFMYCRAAFRHHAVPSDKNEGHSGFRLARIPAS
jgi:serine/threonine protein kinase/formylglycine-generating enzyme required for sulfatase activity